jgi:hypothetical protein
VARCHHRLCGRDFGGVTGFDRHIRLLDGPPWVECVDPATIGMVLTGGVWVRPSPDTSGQGFAA